VWLQLAAAHEYGQGSHATALGHLLKAARLLGRREIYWQAFSLALKLGNTEAMTFGSLENVRENQIRVRLSTRSTVMETNNRQRLAERSRTGVVLDWEHTYLVSGIDDGMSAK
jgi:hypothetical protein